MNAIPTQAPMPTPMPYLVDGPSYTPSQASGTGTAQVFKLSSNESAVGPSPRVLQTIRDAAATQHLYPDPDGARLAHAIAARHGLDPTRIITAPGSDAIINWIIQGWASNGDEVVYSAHGFQSYRIRTSSRGAVPVAAPEKALRADVPALLAAVTPRTRILFIANPNNPTGTYLDSDELAVLRARLRSDILMVVDEAYFEYVDAPDYASALALVRDDSPNVIVTRTFSKFFGLAGLRAGWAYVPSNCVGPLGKLRGPFAVSNVALAAAIEALTDAPHMALASSHNRHWRDWLLGQLREQGFEVTASVGNFALFRVPGGAQAAMALHTRLAQRGYMTRLADQNALADWIRVTVGHEEAMRGLVRALYEVSAV
jgi:histidinol-phosphate aminotransferase